MSTTEQVTNERMQSFIETISKQVHTTLTEREDDLLKAWQENIEEAQVNDKKFPPLKVSISAEVNLETNKIETTIGFTAKYSSSVSEDIPDPNQSVLPFREEGGE